jgi:hypothetical protein
MFTQTSQKAELFTRAFRTIVLGVFAVFVFTLGLLLSQVPLASATTSNVINFQARLETSTGAIAADGNYNVEFKIYTTLSTGGTAQGVCTGNCVWMETRTGGNVVNVANGYLTVSLGSVTPFGGTINWNQQLWVWRNVSKVADDGGAIRVSGRSSR